LGVSPTGWEIDRELGDLRDDRIDGSKLLTYLRYNVKLDRAWLKARLKFDVPEAEGEALRAMGQPYHVDALPASGLPQPRAR
jgi:hypothetical protein